MTEFAFPEFPDYKLQLYQYADCPNIEDIQADVRAGKYELALLSPRTIPTAFCIQLAAYHALAYHQQNSMLSKNLHTELVLCLSGSKQISASLRAFGVKPQTKEVLIAAFNPGPAAVAGLTQLGGRLVPLDLSGSAYVPALPEPTEHWALERIALARIRHPPT